jgi:uncharacterized protein YkwD
MPTFSFLPLLIFGLVVGLPIPGRAQTPLDSATLELERETFALINQYRKAHDFPPLAWSAEIAKVARVHSKDMAEGTVDFGHEGFGGRVSHLREELSGLAGCGENVLMTDDPRDVARKAVALWLQSPPHLHNIRGDYNRSGVGIWENAQGVIYFTQIFVRLKPPADVAEAGTFKPPQDDRL